MASNGKRFSKVRRFIACGGKSLSNDSGKRTNQESKKGGRKLKCGEGNSFVSLFKEPTSSIEKILEDAVTAQGLEQPRKSTVDLLECTSPKASASCSVSPRFYTPKAATPRVLSPKATSPGVLFTRTRSSGEGCVGDVSPGSPKVPSHVAILPKAQSARYASPRVAPPVDLSPTPTPPRPRSSRPSFSKTVSSKGIHREENISRIEPVVQYHHVAAKKIQAAYRGYMSRMSTRSARGLVRLQQFARGQSVKRQIANSTKQMLLLVRVKAQLQSQSFQMLECYTLMQQEQSLGDKQADSIASDAGNNSDWDHSILSNEEKEARNRRKENTVRNKEKARTLLRSRQMSKFTSDAAVNDLMNLHLDGPLWSWNWSERHLLKTILPSHQAKKKESPTPPLSGTPRGSLYLAPRNSQSRTPSRFSQVQIPNRKPRPAPRRSQSPYGMNFTDTDSLRSCSTTSVPHYMTPTASTRAKMRLSDNFHDTYTSSPSIESKRRLSYPLTPCSRTSRGGLFPDSDVSSQRTVRTTHSISNLIASSPGSFPDGRKPFNRFV